MFTGIVQTTARVRELHRENEHARLVLDASHWQPDGGYRPAAGDSIAVAGVCLTLTEPALERLSFDIVAQTLACTNLGALAEGARVNLEPALLASQPLGGHFMQGHVDGMGQVLDVQATADETRITLQPPAELMDYIIPKGSIAVDGVSLTLAAVHEASFEIALIPTTLERTTLGELTPGSGVNLEADMLAKTIVHQLHRHGSGKRADANSITWDTLRQAGFMGD